jgi:hypothetical protein
MLIVGVIILASFLASFTDWIFMDALVHRYYAAAPDIWRPSGGARRIVASQFIGAMATAAVVSLCLLAPGRPLVVAAAIWCAGALPILAQNQQWMRLQPQVAVSHAVGWLARILIAAVMTGWLLAGR